MYGELIKLKSLHVNFIDVSMSLFLLNFLTSKSRNEWLWIGIKMGIYICIYKIRKDVCKFLKVNEEMGFGILIKKFFILLLTWCETGLFHT